MERSDESKDSKMGQVLSERPQHNALRTGTAWRKMSARQVRIARVVDFMQRNLESNLSVERLGRVAHVSKFHFHRQFSETLGLSPMRVVQMLRLKRASFRLIFGDRVSITEIALDAGFANSESFSRAFRNAFGQSPRAFRKKPKWDLWRSRYAFFTRIAKRMNRVEIVYFETTRVAAIEHRGPPDDVYNTTRRFIEWRKANGVSPSTSRTFGIHYDDHRKVRPEDYRIDICATIETDVAPNSFGVLAKTIQGGRCARIRHVGSREYIGSADYLHNEWLPKSGEALRDAPLFFHYVNAGPNVAEHEMITDVYLPLK